MTSTVILACYPTKSSRVSTESETASFKASMEAKGFSLKDETRRSGGNTYIAYRKDEINEQRR